MSERYEVDGLIINTLGTKTHIDRTWDDGAGYMDIDASVFSCLLSEGWSEREIYDKMVRQPKWADSFYLDDKGIFRSSLSMPKCADVCGCHRWTPLKNVDGDLVCRVCSKPKPE